MATAGQDRMESNKSKSKEVAKVNPELLIKHPLQSTWTLWFFKMEANRSWEDSQMEIASFSTVEDFWALFNHIEVASRLNIGCDYSMFKQGIKPMWEDVHNKQGGRWLVTLSKQQRASELDNFWLEALMMLIGEDFGTHSNDVNGAVVNVRGRGDKLGIWTSTATNKDSIMKIGHTLKERMNIPRHVTIGFQAHTDTMVKTGSISKDRYTV